MRSTRKVRFASNTNSGEKSDVSVSNRVLPLLGNSHLVSSQTLEERGEGWFCVLAC